MENIFRYIAKQKVISLGKYNWTPTMIFLGRKEMLALKVEVQALGYDCSSAEGKSRPEVFGLLVYEVNTDEPFLEFL